MPVEPVPIRWTLRGAVVTLPEEIDSANSELVHAALSNALTAAPAVLVADMARTTYCCSEGLRALLTVHQAARAADLPLRIAGAQHPMVSRMFMVSGASRILDVYPSAETALAKTTASPLAEAE
jgi:anti-anti-sigma factor